MIRAVLKITRKKKDIERRYKVEDNTRTRLYNLQELFTLIYQMSREPVAHACKYRLCEGQGLEHIEAVENRLEQAEET